MFVGPRYDQFMARYGDDCVIVWWASHAFRFAVVSLAAGACAPMTDGPNNSAAADSATPATSSEVRRLIGSVLPGLCRCYISRTRLETSRSAALFENARKDVDHDAALGRHDDFTDDRERDAFHFGAEGQQVRRYCAPRDSGRQGLAACHVLCDAWR